MKTLVIVYFALVLIILTACQPSGKEAVVAGNNSCATDPMACGSNGALNGSAYQTNQGYSPYGNGSTGYGTGGSGSGYGSGYGSGSGYQYGNGHGQPFNYYNNNAYLCNCPNGTIPTYNGSAGIGCVSRVTMSSKVNLSAFFYLTWGTNNRWNTLPQLYRYNYGGGNTSCYNGAVQSCTVGQVNNCPGGYVCQMNGSRSTLGLCVASHR